jgi:phosphatidylglycerophosphate synthase
LIADYPIARLLYLSICRALEVGWQAGVWEFFRTAPAEGKSAALKVKPIFISKVNTVMQFSLVGSALSQRVLGWPYAGVTDSLATAAAVTTILSGFEYWRMYLEGRL